MDGVINLDKPAGVTSAQAVNRVKRLVPRATRMGHAGTLDPFATGVLLLLVGRATRRCEQLMSERKTYEATVKFGATTATDDPDSEEQPFGSTTPISRERVELSLRQFVGAVRQRPPAFSALKVKGQRAYDLARQGRKVHLEPRTVHVYSIELLEYDWPMVRLRIECGRGTYIRALARDLGQALEVGAYLRELRRTRIGEYLVEDAVTLDHLIAEGIERHLR